MHALALVIACLWLAMPAQAEPIREIPDSEPRLNQYVPEYQPGKLPGESYRQAANRLYEAWMDPRVPNAQRPRLLDEEAETLQTTTLMDLDERVRRLESQP